MNDGWIIHDWYKSKLVGCLQYEPFVVSKFVWWNPVDCFRRLFKKRRPLKANPVPPPEYPTLKFGETQIVAVNHRVSKEQVWLEESEVVGSFMLEGWDLRRTSVAFRPAGFSIKDPKAEAISAVLVVRNQIFASMPLGRGNVHAFEDLGLQF